MYFVGIAQPEWPAAKQPGYNGLFFTRREKLLAAREFGTSLDKPMPLCIEKRHDNDAASMTSAVIGHVTGMLVDTRDNVLIAGYVDSEHHWAADLILGITTRDEKWISYLDTVCTLDSNHRIVSKRWIRVSMHRKTDVDDESSVIRHCSTEIIDTALAMDREVVNGGVANAISLRAWGMTDEKHIRSITSALDSHIQKEEMLLVD